MLVHDLGLSHRACDRCHGQKLRCRRESNSNTCLRCAKAGVHCVTRPMRLRSRAQSGTNPQQHQSQPYGSDDVSMQDRVLNQEARTASAEKELSVDFSQYLGSHSSALQAELHSALGALQSPPGSAESRRRSRCDGQQSCPEVSSSRPRSAEQSVQAQCHDAPSKDDSGDLYDFSVPPRMLSSFPVTFPKNHIALARNMSPHSTHLPALDEIMTNFDQAGGGSKSFLSQDPGDNSDYGNEECFSDILQLHDQDVQDSESEPHDHHQDFGEPSDPNPDMDPSNVSLWVRRLSDINVQLHQHMHSIPVVETGPWSPNSNSENSPISVKIDAQHSIERTFRLSAQYTEALATIRAESRLRSSCDDAQTLANLTLDQPSQLLLLSCYMCLLESYDKILKHIKAWIDARLKMGAEGGAATLLHFPTKLPSLAIGSFELPETSPLQPIVVTSIVETNMIYMHSMITEIMGLASFHGSKTVDLDPRTAENRSMNGIADGSDGLSSVAKVTLQAIKANESSTLELVNLVSKLAIRCVVF